MIHVRSAISCLHDWPSWRHDIRGFGCCGGCERLPPSASIFETPGMRTSAVSYAGTLVRCNLDVSVHPARQSSACTSS